MRRGPPRTGGPPRTAPAPSRGAAIPSRALPHGLDKAFAQVPLKTATLSPGFLPLPIKSLGLNFYDCASDREWLSLSGHDWTIIRIEDLATGKCLPITPDTTLRGGLRVVFLCSEHGVLTGYPSQIAAERSSKKVLCKMAVGDELHCQVRICRTSYVQKSGRGRVAIAGDNTYTLLPGARLISKDADNCRFEYRPLDRLLHNFGEVSELKEAVRFEVLFFAEGCVAPSKRLGIRNGGPVEGLDLRAKYGVNLLGIARRQPDEEWAVSWNPSPDFEIFPGDLCIALPVPGGFQASCTELFNGRVRYTVRSAGARCWPARSEHRSSERLVLCRLMLTLGAFCVSLFGAAAVAHKWQPWKHCGVGARGGALLLLPPPRGAPLWRATAAGPALRRHAGRGFGTGAPRRRKRAAVSPEQLRDDHGEDRWEAIARILAGGKASSPEEMLRARFSAIRNRDAQFMGRTEVSKEFPKLDRRVRGWAVAMGLREKTAKDKNDRWEAILTVERLEILRAEGLEVEYRMHCGPNGVLYERPIFKEDPEAGYIYTGESVFSDWAK